MRWKNVDNTVDSCGCTDGMQRGKYKVTCLGCGYGCGNRIEVTHLSDEDNIRVFTKCGTKCISITICIHTNFTLVDDRFLVLMQVLDRVLQCNDMMTVIFINFIDQRSQRCRFTTTCRSCYQDQSSLFIYQVNNGWRQPQTFRFRNFCIDQTDYESHGAFLLKYVYTESSMSRDRIREIRLSCLIKGRYQTFWNHLLN